MIKKMSSDASRTEVEWTFTNDWRLKLYMSHGRRAHIMLFDPRGDARFVKNYDYYQMRDAVKDAEAWVEFYETGEIRAEHVA